VCVYPTTYVSSSAYYYICVLLRTSCRAACWADEAAHDARAHATSYAPHAPHTLPHTLPHAGLPAGLTKRLMTRVAAMLDGGDGSDVLWWVLEEAGPAQPSGLDYAALLRAYRCASDAHAAAALRTGMRHRIRHGIRS